jgi:23S rRNA (cytosine1962-C5)-methyltransferase
LPPPLAPVVAINRRAEQRLESGHPWVYSSDVTSRGLAEPGDVVRVTCARGKLLGTAHYSSTSQICLRLLSRRAESIDRKFLTARLAAAIEFRRRVSPGDVCRLVYGEADLLPGLVADRYGDYLVLQLLDQGMDRAAPLIADCLNELLAPRGILARNDVTVRRLEDLPLEPRVLAGEIPERAEIACNGLRWLVDLARGQKTGIYLDQRENYFAAARHARGRALDCFTSTGGFALHLAGACEHVEAVDSSADALAAAAANRDLNGIANIDFREANVFDLLSASAAARRRFDTIVLDPPAFAKSRRAIDAAIRGYKEINTKALRLLGRGGVLITCSCSFHLSEAELLTIVAEAALDAGRTLRVLERRTQAADHPILLTVPETHYLKCLILEAL